MPNAKAHSMTVQPPAFTRSSRYWVGPPPCPIAGPARMGCTGCQVDAEPSGSYWEEVWTAGRSLARSVGCPSSS